MDSAIRDIELAVVVAPTVDPGLEFEPPLAFQRTRNHILRTESCTVLNPTVRIF